MTIPIIINSKNQNELDVKLKNFLSEANFSLIDFESENLIQKFANILENNKTKHCIVVNDSSCINKKLIKFINNNEQNLFDIDFFQISGGEWNLLFFINTARKIFYQIPFMLPLFIIQFIELLMFFDLNKKYKTKTKNLILIKKTIKDILTKEPKNLYLKNRLYWNVLQPSLRAYFISSNWIEALNYLYDPELITLERANVALARTGNFKSTSKLKLIN